MDWGLIGPTNRPGKFLEFLKAWQPLFVYHEVTLVVMEDAPERSGEISHALQNAGLRKSAHLCWKDIPADSLIPRKTDMVRSFAFRWAFENTMCMYMLTLDDDVTPEFNDVFEEYEKVFLEGAPLSEFLDVGALTSSGLQMRGYPYKDRVKRPVAVQYGGWHGVLDYDAATQLAVPKREQAFHGIVMPVPKGAAATCCIMNCAWKVEYTPIMWQLPMFDGRYNRVGDIWSGLFIKKTLDSIDAVMVINGAASVVHDRASNPYESLKKEAPSVYMNDHLWEALTSPQGLSMLEAYRQVTSDAYAYFLKFDESYANHFLAARNQWTHDWV